MTHDYYALLGVQPDASPDDIRRAYRRKIAEAHPDKPEGDAELARALDEARQVLLDPVRRAEYDAHRLGAGLLDEALDALTEVGERAVEQLGHEVERRGRSFLAALRDQINTKRRRQR